MKSYRVHKVPDAARQDNNNTAPASGGWGVKIEPSEDNQKSFEIDYRNCDNNWCYEIKALSKTWQK